MSELRTALTSTVVAWVPAALATVVAVVITWVAVAASGGGVTAVIVALVAVAVGGVPASLRLAAVRVVVSAAELGFGPGLRGRLRWLRHADVVQAEVVRITWPQVYGLGLRPERRLTRLLVRAGPALSVRVASGEHIYLTAADPVAVVETLRSGRESAHE